MMNPRIKDYLGWVGLLALIALVVLGVQAVNAYSRASVPAATFAVTGEGRVDAVPDTAQFSFGLTTEGGKDIAALQQQNTTKMNAAIDFVKSEGVDAKDIQTSSYNISPRYQYSNCPVPTSSARPCPPPEIVGYTINQTVTVKMRDFSKIGDTMTGVAARGANNISSLNFTLHDKDEAENQARTEAMAKAKAKAQAMAEGAGFSLGRIISISETGAPQPIYYDKAVYGMGMGASAAAPSPNIQPGTNEIVKDVTVTYEIR